MSVVELSESEVGYGNGYISWARGEKKKRGKKEGQECHGNERIYAKLREMVG